MEIRGVSNRTDQPDVSRDTAKQIPQAKVTSNAAQKERLSHIGSLNTNELESVLKDLEEVSVAFNKRLKFTLNKELGQVIVKVIDGNTDKVVKELPPEALQRLYIRIREAIGLLIDEKI